MQLIIKPAGLIIILGTITALSILLFFRSKAAPFLTTVTTNAPNVIPSVSPSPVPVTAKSLPKSILLEPDIASKEWDWLLQSGQAESKIVSSTVLYHPYARQIRVTRLGKYWFDIQIAHPISVALKKGKRIRLSFWARSKDSCPITIAVEQNTLPYTKITFKQKELSPNWQVFSEDWVQKFDTPENWAKMDFQLGHKTGTVELTGVIIREID